MNCASSINTTASAIREYCASRRLNTDTSAHRFGQTACDRQTQTRAPFVCIRVSLLKGLEQLAQQLRRDPRTRVQDLEETAQITARHWPLALGHQPLVIGNGPLAIGHQPLAIDHQPLAIGNGPLAAGLQPGDTQGHAASFGELDGVAQQIDQRLPQLAFVPMRPPPALPRHPCLPSARALPRPHAPLPAILRPVF